MSIIGDFFEEDKERLEKFEGVLSELMREFNRTSEEMERLRGAGKEKSVRYRELMGRKLMYSSMASMFERHGLL